MVEIREVTSKKELKQFVDFPNQLYKNNPYFVPALRMDELATLDPKKNVAFEHAKARYWMAYKDGKIVGRIAGIFLEKYEEKWGQKRVRFGWIDFKTVAPLDEAMTEEQWNGYMNWLSRTLNRKLVILELGEGFMQPTVIRWPFEKTVMINQKSCMYRVHKTFYQIADEIKERAVAVKADSVEFVAQWKEN